MNDNNRPAAYQQKRIGILLTNLGTPDAPTTAAVRRYLKEFLSDPRVVELPRILWLPILYGIILPFRSPKSAKLYQKIWTPEGSPLRVILEKQAQALQNIFPEEAIIIPAMRYGQPSIKNALAKLKENNIQKLVLFPLYPQYSATTTATTFDEVANQLKQWRWQPELRVINGYHDEKLYLDAIAKSVENHWQEKGKTEKLLFSFHGLPKAFLLKGDPYYCFCQKTARLVAESLALNKENWEIAFQSRLGKAEWLQPYTDKVLKTWAEQGIKKVTVICPGFSADCLETLEEIQQLNQEIFLRAGGEVFHYVPALNTSEAHLQLLSHLIRKHSQGW